MNLKRRQTMTRVKKILTISVIIALLVPMLVFAGEFKLINVPIDYYIKPHEKMFVEVTNYKGESPEYKDRELSIIIGEDNKKHGYFEYPFHIDAVFNTAVVKKGTTIRVDTNQKASLKKQFFVHLKVYPILEKRDGNVILVGKPIRSVNGTLDSSVKTDLYDVGEYMVELTRYSEDRGSDLQIAYLKVEGDGALPTKSTVLVDSEQVAFEAYMIENSNYFKLRDFAYAVNGTDKQFEVEWDSEKSAINLVSNQSYTSNGQELKKGDGKPKAPALNGSKIYKDKEEINLKAYTIGGNNYFKLRDLADAFGIAVTWDDELSTIGIDTKTK